MRRDPAIFTGMAGTVGISSVGMFARGVAGWGIFNGTHSLDLDVGSITRKPAVIHGRIEPREIMSLTMTFDHAVIDGGPAAHFAGRLVERIERGAGLAEDLETSGGQPAAASRMVTPA